MVNELIIVKLQQRLDKLSSLDYSNLETWMYIEAFNKGYISWIRRQLEGINQTRTGAESTTRRIDDLQFLLTTSPIITMINHTIYWSGPLPTNYLQWNRLSAQAISPCCPPRSLIIFESIEADRDINLMDSGKQPSYDWATTFATLSSSDINIYTNNLFGIGSAQLTYYRVPLYIQIAGVANPNDPTSAVSTIDVLCEAPDNVIEIIIDEAKEILATDIQNYQLANTGKISAEGTT